MVTYSRGVIEKREAVPSAQPHIGGQGRESLLFFKFLDDYGRIVSAEAE